jgi:ribonuclease BN (tRNA processing enzyme)
MLEIRFWGVRGSIAAAGPSTAVVGGNTSCVEVRGPGEELVILDAGTGLRPLGAALDREAAERGRPTVLHLFLSHFHWDHIQGFPFFTPAFRPTTELSVYGPERCAQPSGDIRRAFDAQMRAPHFPVGLDAMRAQLSFRGLAAGVEFSIGALTVRAGAARHPNGCLAYRISHGDRAIVYATDTGNCHSGNGPGKDLGNLTLNGGAPKVYTELTVEISPNFGTTRVDKTTPEKSLVLTMPSAESPPDPHPNVTFTGPTDADYMTILAWIKEGAKNN